MGFVCSLVKLWEPRCENEPIGDDLKAGKVGDQVHIQGFQNDLPCLNRIKCMKGKNEIKFRYEKYKESEATEVFMAKKALLIYKAGFKVSQVCQFIYSKASIA